MSHTFASNPPSIEFLYVSCSLFVNPSMLRLLFEYNSKSCETVSNGAFAASGEMIAIAKKIRVEVNNTLCIFEECGGEEDISHVSLSENLLVQVLLTEGASFQLLHNLEIEGKRRE